MSFVNAKMDNTTNKGRVVLHTTLFNQQAPGDLSQSLLMNAYYKSETVVDEALIKMRITFVRANDCHRSHMDCHIGSMNLCGVVALFTSAI